MPPPTEVQVEGIAAGGRGIARVDGLVWFVEGAVPGDRVLAVPRSRGPRVVEARAERFVLRSALRRAVPCPVQERCGGCAWMALEESAQRDFKRKIVEDALQRIGALRDVTVEPLIPSPLPLGYRNKVELTFGPGADGAPALGFHPPGDAREVIDVEECLVQGASANRALTVVREFFLHGPGRDASILRDAPEPVRVVLRRTKSGGILVALRDSGAPFPEEKDFVRALTAALPELQSVVRLVAAPGRRGGTTSRALHGSPWLEEEVAGTKFQLPAATFFQVNSEAAELLVELVVDLAGPLRGKRVLELYGGIGVFSLALARQGARAHVCDADPDAIACGLRAARDNGKLPVTFERADVGRFLRGFRGRPDIVVADPPRTGLGRGVAEALAVSGAERILLVSCDPATLSRDLRPITTAGYAPRRVVPLDLFPQTPHVEVVVLLTRTP